MNRKQSRQKRISPRDQGVDERARIVDRLRMGCLAIMTALFVASVLLPTDSIPDMGIAVVLSTLWIVLLGVWLLASLLNRDGELRWGPTSWVLLVVLATHVISVVVLIATEQGNARAALNMLARWLSFGAAFLLVRQLVTTQKLCRALCAVMIATVVGISAFGVFQYFVINPSERAQFWRLSPERQLQQLELAGLGRVTRDSPQWQHSVDRLDSTETRGMFALANSLGALITPWLIVVAGLVFSIWKRYRKQRGALVAAAIALLVIGFCLALTKSRTSLMATVIGLGLLALHIWFYGLGWSWKIPVITVLIFVFVLGGAIAVGGIDREVVSEAFKSFSYRLEYWQSTWGMIGDHPWLGCGPGNFKSVYTYYKLPQASETVADPHNWLLELWATAGTPALIAFLGLLICFVRQVYRGMTIDRPSSTVANGARSNSGEAAVRAIFVGGLLGLVLAYPCGLLVEVRLHSAVWFVALPMSVACLWLLIPWIEQGVLPVSLLVIAMIALLVNLLAAGGISFPGVVLSFWLLLAVALNLVEAAGQPPRLPKAGRIGIAALWLCVWVAVLTTTFIPTMYAIAALDKADYYRRQGDPHAALEALLNAAELDPYSPKPWREAANFSLSIWFHPDHRTEANLRQFEESVQQYLRRDPRSHAAHNEAGGMYLAAYRVDPQPRLLDQSIEYYRESVAAYPNSNFEHAQLAYVLQLAGRAGEAREQAELALKYDAVHPHVEQKLGQRRIVDGRPPDEETPTAEQIVNKIRKTVDDKIR